MEHPIQQQAMIAALKVVWPGLPGKSLAAVQLVQALSLAGFTITPTETE